jgi:mannose-6-phosphate isomerase-like protein (cupin superfamily)
MLCFATVVTATHRHALADEGGCFIERDADVKQPGPGPHGGLGKSTGYIFFENTPNLHYSFRKRVLHKGATIGYHKQDVDEVYYFLNGKGTMALDGKEVPVKPGDCVLTRKGSSHGTVNTGDGDLTIIVVFEK